MYMIKFHYTSYWAAPRRSYACTKPKNGFEYWFWGGFASLGIGFEET